LMQGRRDLDDVASLIMSELTPVVSAQHGAFFLAMSPGDSDEVGPDNGDDGAYELRMRGSYGYSAGSMPTSFRPGETLIGTAAEEKRTIQVDNVPPGYLKISSGLGEAPPAHVIVLPVLFAAVMSLFDSLDGIFMSRAYGWAFLQPVRKVYYNLTVTVL
ncbi:GAF domain-containing protein, partial [Streptomyces lonegramiae]